MSNLRTVDMDKLIKFLEELDPQGVDGTVQSFIYAKENLPDNHSLTYRALIRALFAEKRHLVEENIKFSNQTHGYWGDKLD